MLLLAACIKLLQFLSGTVVKFVVPARHVDRGETELLVTGHDPIKNSPEPDGETKINVAQPKEAQSHSAHGSSKSKPTLEETCTLLLRLGSILVFFFICDKTTLLKHVDKHYERDHFLCICLLLLIGGISTLKKNHAKDVEILNREQTEEWKG